MAIGVKYGRVSVGTVASQYRNEVIALIQELAKIGSKVRIYSTPHSYP